jgi:CDP-glucose 4,6-dehydratase
MADILTQSWMNSFPKIPTAIGRAGNVIGGGDVSPDRLLPDLVLSLINNVKPKLRNPSSVRPWQHVLDCINGYTMLIDKLCKGNATGAWNFGPSDEDYRTVGELTQLVLTTWGKDPRWLQDERTYSAESDYLTLDSVKARTALKWRDKWDFNESVTRTANWHRLASDGESKFELSGRDIAEFENEEIVP